MGRRKSITSVEVSTSDNGSIRPVAPPPDGRVPLAFRRGTKYPQAIAWFGFRSFWGHLWSLAAGAIATEDIDSRDWMRPDLPRDLLARIAEQLGARVPVAEERLASTKSLPGDSGPLTRGATTLAEALDRDVWIDFVADTGDDVSVSRAVAELLFATYTVDDPEASGKDMMLPRGDLLVFGGDTAYPVATELEIHNRVIVPWNQVLRARADGKTRVLLGIPGNHDWYGGLDGFGRMFRAPLGTIDRASVVAGEIPGEEPVGKIDQLGQIRHFFEWVEALRIGKRVEKRGALPLLGYAPVQSASYWALPLAPSLDLWGPDRQLYAMDTRQRLFFASRRDEADRGLLLCMADPPYAFLEPHPAGQDILNGLDLSFGADKLFALTGDIHHYCRLEFPEGGLQVTAGGGGAFLHPARIARKGLLQPKAELPGPKTSRILAAQIPLQLALGRAGFVLHVALGLAYLPMQGLVFRNERPDVLSASITGALLTVLLALIAGVRGPKKWGVFGLALTGGVALTFVPFAMNLAATALGPRWPFATRSLVLLAYALMPFPGVFILGVYLMVLTVLGLATDQGFGPLAHPGYKHFVRLRVRRDGSQIDAWTLGKVDPVRPNSPVVLVDRFTWKNPRAPG